MSSHTKIPVLAALVLSCLVVYRYIIYPAFLSPLSKVANAHPTSSISPLWIWWVRYSFRENRTIYAAHKKHGPVVRLSPSELSVNCVDQGLRTIYAGGFEKHAWYRFFANFDGVANMFSTIPSKPHSMRKRMLANIYSKSYLQNSASLSAISRILIFERFLPKVEALAASGAAVDVHRLFNLITMDLVTAYQFGLCNSSNFIQEDTTAKWWLDLYHSRKHSTFFPQELPDLCKALTYLSINLSPKFVAAANHQLEDWCLQMCDAAERQLDGEKLSESADSNPENIPVVYSQLKQSLDAESRNLSSKPPPSHAQRLIIASEMLDQLAAGQETSDITLTYLFHELARRPTLQEALRTETLSLSPPLTLSSPSSSDGTLPSPKSLDALPLLHALLMETLRLHPAIPGPQPRITPRGPNTTLGPHANIPGGVRVSASAYSLHRNAAVFPDPEHFHPERWLPPTTATATATATTSPAEEARRAEQHRWFWAFGSGGRMCIGSNLAMQEMKLIAAAVVSNFRVDVVDDDDDDDDHGLEQEDSYTAQPRAGRLMLRIERLG